MARRFRDEFRFPLVYDCHDLLSGFQNISGDILTAESELLSKADLVLFSSQGLADRYHGVRRWLLVRNAVTSSHFEAASRTAAVSPRPAGTDGLTAGYLGALDSWFDIEAVEQSAALHPQCRFILAGRVEYEPIWRLKSLPNVDFTGEISYDRVPGLLSQWGVGLIPFRINPLTLMTNPIKLYEYFSCGLPVVSTALPEAQAMGDLVYLAGTPADFAQQVTQALSEDDPSRRARRREIAGRESWTERAREISRSFPELLDADIPAQKPAIQAGFPQFPHLNP